MQYTFAIPAGEDEIFSKEAFDKAIGFPIPISMFGKVIHKGTLISAVVAEDGKSVEVTIDSEDAK